MSRVEIQRPPPVAPKFVVTMTEAEANLVRALLGMMDGYAEKALGFTSELYYDLDEALAEASVKTYRFPDKLAVRVGDVGGTPQAFTAKGHE